MRKNAKIIWLVVASIALVAIIVIIAAMTLGKTDKPSGEADTTELTTTATFDGEELDSVKYAQGKYTPKSGKTILAIGQDLETVRNYTADSELPDPAAVVSYLSFFGLTEVKGQNNYGGLGMDNDGNATSVDTDWGAGFLNAEKSATEWKNSALILALNIGEQENPNGLLRIANGEFDTNIEKLALFCNKFPEKQIFLRIGYEFDGKWNGEDGGGYHKTENYIAAWRHIVDKMRELDVTNVAYVWQASTSPSDDVCDAKWGKGGGNINTPKEDISAWYPGDDYVDWIGLSWFLSQDELDSEYNFPSEIAGQEELATDVVEFARSRAVPKPVMICESSPQGFDLCTNNSENPTEVARKVIGGTIEGAAALFGQKGKENLAIKSGNLIENMTAEDAFATWYKPYFDFINENRDIIRGVTYINANWDACRQFGASGGYSGGYWGDARIESNSAMKELWLEEITGENWLHADENLAEKLNP